MYNFSGRKSIMLLEYVFVWLHSIFKIILGTIAFEWCVQKSIIMTFDMPWRHAQLSFYDQLLVTFRGFGNNSRYVRRMHISRHGIKSTVICYTSALNYRIDLPIIRRDNHETVKLPHAQLSFSSRKLMTFHTLRHISTYVKRIMVLSHVIKSTVIYHASSMHYTLDLNIIVR